MTPIPSIDADGDDLNGTDDEDGVTFGTFQVGAVDATITVNVSEAAFLDAWFDFNRDGNWNGVGEQIFNSTPVTAGDNVLTFSIPSTARSGATFTRFRVSSTGGLSPTGLSPDGEVEDYRVLVDAPGGTGIFEGPREISIQANGAYSISSADIDGDGDLDVASASANDQKIAWYENVNGDGTTFQEHTVEIAPDRARAIHTADVNSDGHTDLVVATGLNIIWYENDGADTPNFESHTVTTQAITGLSVSSVDLDGDGDLDLVSASAGNHRISWHENHPTADNGVRWEEHIVAADAFLATDVHIADMDGDGDNDLISSAKGNGQIAWYENDNGNFTKHLVAGNVSRATSVFAADLDNDNATDIVATSQITNQVLWFRNEGSFFPQRHHRFAPCGREVLHRRRRR